MDLALERRVDVLALSGLGREIRPLADLRALVGLVRLARRFRPHVVHTHTAKAGVLGRVAARPRPRAGGRAHLPRPRAARVLRPRHERRLPRDRARPGAAGPTASSRCRRASRPTWSRWAIAPADRIRVVPLGLELDAVHGSPAARRAARGRGLSRRRRRSSGMVGRLAPVKDVPTFLRAARLVRVASPGRALQPGGRRPGARRRSRRRCRRSASQDAVCFHGWRRDLPAVYGDLDVVVNASRNEGTPVALIEALAAGRPVVATAVGGTPDVLAAAPTACSCPPQDDRSAGGRDRGGARRHRPRAARAAGARARARALRRAAPAVATWPTSIASCSPRAGIA